MKKPPRFVRWLFAALLICCQNGKATGADHVGRGRRGMVASVHPLATEAGVNAMRAGGNAIDAAIATALTLGVVDGFNSGIGGGCFILIRRSDGRLIAIDGRETAPAKAHRDMFIRKGRAVPALSQIGALATGVPGALAAYHQAASKHGKLAWPALVLPAAKIAREGFPISSVYAANLRSKAKDLAKFAGTREILLDAKANPFPRGHRLVQTDLANTYRNVARNGIGWFYRGPPAKRIEKWMSANGGIMTASDLANYEAKPRAPIVTTYRGFTIVGFPPPSSGGIHIAQIMNTLEKFDLKRLYEKDRATFVHVMAEAMKPAFADRTHWLGDADFAAVPRGLLSKAYASKFAHRIDLKRASKVESHGKPPAWKTDVFGKHTTHIAAADQQGNWVAITQTINTTFGSKVIIPGTGVIMNNEMDDFSAQPGAPNAFGLLGAEANAVAPGKRPLSSMSPTIVLRDGKPVMTVGAAGGGKIITEVVMALVYRLDLNKSVGDVVAAPRFHHQWMPDALFLETAFPDDLATQLKARGHRIRRLRHVGITQAITLSADGKMLEGAHDPRTAGRARGW